MGKAVEGQGLQGLPFCGHLVKSSDHIDPARWLGKLMRTNGAMSIIVNRGENIRGDENVSK